MKRIVGLALVLLAIVLAIALSHAVQERRAFAERWALSVFADLGVGPVRLEVTDVGPEGATVRGLEVGDPVTFSVDQLEFTWRPSEIARLEISELAVTGLHLKASVDENGEPSWGALNPAFEGEGDGSLAALPRTVTLAGGRVELATPFGGVSLHDIAGTLAPDPDRLGTGELQASLRDTASPERFSPVELDVRAEPSGTAGVALELSARLLGGAVSVSGTGSALPESGTGELDLALAPVAFGPEAVQLAALAPAFAAQLPIARGSVSGRLQLRASEHESEPYSVAGDLRIDDLDLQRSEARLEGLTGRIRVAGPGAWRTQGLQELHFDLLDLVGAVRDGSVRFESRETDVHLESFRGGWAGGQIVTRGRFDPMNQTGGLTVQLADIDLERLLETLDIGGLEGTGRISGAVPIVFEGESLQVGAALAAGSDGGVIHWKPAAGAAQRLGLTGDLAVVADALEDYHYEVLQVGIEGDLAGDVRMRLSLRGNNPAYDGGRPVHLDLQVETNVPATLLASQAASRMPEALERRLRERARR